MENSNDDIQAAYIESLQQEIKNMRSILILLSIAVILGILAVARTRTQAAQYEYQIVYVKIDVCHHIKLTEK